MRGSIFQRYGKSWAFALRAKLYGENAKEFSIGGQYKFDNDLLVKAKIWNYGLLGLILKHKLSETIRAMYHISFNVNNPTLQDCKFGVFWSILG